MISPSLADVEIAGPGDEAARMPGRRLHLVPHRGSAIFITSGVASARRRSLLIATSEPVARSIARCTAPKPPVPSEPRIRKRACRRSRGSRPGRSGASSAIISSCQKVSAAARTASAIAGSLRRLGPLQRLDHASLRLVAPAELGERPGEHDAGIELVARQVVVDEALERVLERVDRVLRDRSSG